MGYEKEILKYAEKVMPLCVDNDTISDELFKEY